METVDVAKYARTEQTYDLGRVRGAQQLGNSLILANFVQFLYLTRNVHKMYAHQLLDESTVKFLFIFSVVSH